MNVQKLAITGATVALLFGSAAGAFAGNKHHRGTSVDVDVTNSSNLTNNVTTKANTGHNDIEASSGISLWTFENLGGYGGSVKNSDITTGNAWASSTVLNDVNNTTVDLCGCLSNLRRGSRVDIDVTNSSNLTNNVTTKANSGYNYIGGGRVRNSDINTGNAGAEAWVDSMVNTTVVGGGSE